MNRKLKSICGRIKKVLAILAVLCVPALAQRETGSISGTITDQTGAVIAGATVTVTNTGTGAVRTTTTGAMGGYTLLGLPPASYVLLVTGSGFAPYKETITVAVASQNTVNAGLHLAKAGEVVEVTVGVGNVQVETQTAEISTMVSSQQVSELPSLTRNPYDFVALAGNVTMDQGYSRGANGMAMNGQRSASTDILLDGGENVDMYNATVGQQVPIDSVQEFRVSTSDFASEYGRASGGVVNVATKSGTNSFHGSAYEFNRLSKLAANTYDNKANGIERSVFTRNQFGFSVGGPVIKNKLFFFNNAEFIRIRGNATDQAYVPDSAFLARTAPATQEYFSTYGKLKSDSAVIKTLNAGWLTDNGYGGSGLAALPSSTPVLDLVRYKYGYDVGGGTPGNTTEEVARVDYNFNDKTQIFGRYAYYKQSLFPGWVSASAYQGFDTGENIKNHNAMFSLTHVWSTNLLSNTKLSFSRLKDLQPQGTAGTAPGLMIGYGGNGVTVDGQNNMLPGYLPYAPGSALPFGGPQNLGEIDQSLSWTHGNHSFKFGAQYMYIRDNRKFGAYEEGIEYLSSGDWGTAYDNMLTGNLKRFSVAIYPQNEFPCFRDPISNLPIQTPGCTLTGPATPPNFSRSNRYNDGAAYAQDTWKVRSRLTLSLGVRWEYYGVQHDKHRSNDANFVLGPGRNVYQQVASGFVVNGTNLPAGRLWAKQLTNFAPRIGFAYDLFGDGKTSVRGGYGIAYERNFGNVTYNVIQNPPNYGVLDVRAGRDVPSLSITTNNFGIAGQSGTYPFRSPTLRAVDTNIKNAYADVYNLSVEHELVRGAVAGLEYSGSRGIHGYTIQSYNDIGWGPAFTGNGCGAKGGADCANPLQQLNNQYSYINYRGNGNDSWHNALNAKLTTNNLFNKGLTVTANYTWSHTEDYSSATFGGSDEWSGQGLGTLDPFAPRLDKGDADFDVRSRFYVSAVWTIPFAKNTHGIWNRALDGWELAPIVEARTGYPYTIYDCTNAQTAYNCARYIPSARVSRDGTTSTSSAATLGPNSYAYETIPAPLVYGSMYAGNSTIPTCASDPSTGLSTGYDCSYPANMTSRNAFRQPGFWNTNFGIYKNFKMTEKIKLQFRAEMYNTFNHSNYYVQTGSINNINGLADVGNLQYQSGTTTNYATGTNNGQIEYFTASGAPATYDIQGKKGVQQAAANVGTKSTGERRFVQFALKVNF